MIFGDSILLWGWLLLNVLILILYSDFLNLKLTYICGFTAATGFFSLKLNLFDVSDGFWVDELNGLAAGLFKFFNAIKSFSYSSSSSSKFIDFCTVWGFLLLLSFPKKLNKLGW